MAIELNYSKNQAGEILVRNLAHEIAMNPKQSLIFYSGGSALVLLSLLFDNLASRKFDYSLLVFAPVDERFDPVASNFVSLKQMPVYEKFVQAGAKFVDTAIEDGTVEDAANWYNQWVSGELKRIQLVKGHIFTILGMGPDGHTAGIFPYPDNSQFFTSHFCETERMVVGYDVGEKNQYTQRFTLTLPALQRAGASFAYVTGAGKKEMLAKVVETAEDPHEVPARLWHRLSPISLYTDIEL
jgi:6-phosphogluconolactonase/glucosamine-6-phosphate isomerase/deaminase